MINIPRDTPHAKDAFDAGQAWPAVGVHPCFIGATWHSCSLNIVSYSPHLLRAPLNFFLPLYFCLYTLTFFTASALYIQVSSQHIQTSYLNNILLEIHENAAHRPSPGTVLICCPHLSSINNRCLTSNHNVSDPILLICLLVFEPQK